MSSVPVDFADRLKMALAEYERSRAEQMQCSGQLSALQFRLRSAEAEDDNLSEVKAHRRKMTLFRRMHELHKSIQEAEVASQKAHCAVDIALARLDALRYELRAQELTVRAIELRAKIPNR